MTFRVTKKVGNRTEIVGTCEKLSLSDRCTSSNCHEYSDIENYYVSDLGKYLTTSCDRVVRDFESKAKTRCNFQFQ